MTIQIKVPTLIILYDFVILLFQVDFLYFFRKTKRTGKQYFSLPQGFIHLAILFFALCVVVKNSLGTNWARTRNPIAQQINLDQSWHPTPMTSFKILDNYGLSFKTILTIYIYILEYKNKNRCDLFRPQWFMISKSYLKVWYSISLVIFVPYKKFIYKENNTNIRRHMDQGWKKATIKATKAFLL